MKDFMAIADQRLAPAVDRPRVCLVIGQLGLGGCEKQVVLLARGLHRRGVDVSVVVFWGGAPREADLRSAGVPLVDLGLPSTRGWRTAVAMVVGCTRLARYLRRTRPAVVHAFLYYTYVLTAPAARLARVPVVIAGRRSLDDFTRGRPIARLLERVATWMTDLLVANARAVADCVRATERVPAAKLDVIYNGLPQEAFLTAEPAELDTTDPVVLCVANLRPYKGHTHLFDAIRLLRDRGQPTTLVVAGEGPELSALRRQADRLDIDVRLLGSRTDIDRLLARSDVAVLPSLTEGMSNAVMEAMAAGLPVVGTTVGGTPELLADGRGILVRPGDVAALADAIGFLLADPDRARRMGRAAREWCQANLHCDTMVQRHLDLYSAMVHNLGDGG